MTRGIRAGVNLQPLKPTTEDDIPTVGALVSPHDDLRAVFDRLHGAMPEPIARVWRYETIMRLLAEVARLRGEGSK